MPVTKTAKRALKVSRTKTGTNAKILTALEIAVKSLKKSPTESNLKKLFSVADRASKKNVIHKNKAGRIKAAGSKLLKKK